jgi:hypothetical protein
MRSVFENKLEAKHQADGDQQLFPSVFEVCDGSVSVPCWDKGIQDGFRHHLGHVLVGSVFELVLDAPGGGVAGWNAAGTVFEDMGDGFFAFAERSLQLVEMVLNAGRGDLRPVVRRNGQTESCVCVGAFGVLWLFFIENALDGQLSGVFHS